jgi:hypothetical protein
MCSRTKRASHRKLLRFEGVKATKRRHESSDRLLAILRTPAMQRVIGIRGFNALHQGALHLATRGFSSPAPDGA